MNASSLISSLIVALVTPFVIAAIRKPTSRFEERTSRLQYWKVFFEVAPLAGHSVRDETKQLCLRELAEADDETENLNNKFVGFVANILTLIAIFFVVSIISQITILYEKQMRLYLPATSRDQLESWIDKFSLASLTIQALVTCACWLWLRWEIRCYVWNGLRPGRFFHPLLTANDRLQALAKLGLLFLLLLALRFIL